jgi:hypothetical protein
MDGLFSIFRGDVLGEVGERARITVHNLHLELGVGKN